MGMIFMFLAAPLQGLLPVFAQSVLKGGPGLFGLMLSAIGLGSILGAFLLSCIPSYYPRHHLIPLAMCVFPAIGLLFSLSTTPALSLSILVASGCFWLLSLNPSNTAQSTPGTDANRRAGPVGHDAGATGRDAAWPPFRGLFCPLYVPRHGSCALMLGTLLCDGGLFFRA